LSFDVGLSCAKVLGTRSINVISEQATTFREVKEEPAFIGISPEELIDHARAT